MFEKHETRLEAILDKNNIEVTSIVKYLGAYLNSRNYAEDLTLDQYKKIRRTIGVNGEGWDLYLKNVNEEIAQGLITKEQAIKTNELFTSYLRLQHAKLKDEKYGIQTSPASHKESDLINPKIVGQKETDAHLYDLERAVYGAKSFPREEHEKRLMETMPTRNLNKYQIEILERMGPRTRFKRKLNSVLKLLKRKQAA